MQTVSKPSVASTRCKAHHFHSQYFLAQQIKLNSVISMQVHLIAHIRVARVHLASSVLHLISTEKVMRHKKWKYIEKVHFKNNFSPYVCTHTPIHTFNASVWFWFFSPWATLCNQLLRLLLFTLNHLLSLWGLNICCNSKQALKLNSPGICLGTH